MEMYKEKRFTSLAQWFIPVILVLQEAEIGKIVGSGQPGEKFVRPCLIQ
jgi:hypothetical protein